MSDLRSKVIRLAHAKPSLRPHLLPLLKTALPSKIPYPDSIRLQSPQSIEAIKETGKKKGWFGGRGSGQTAEDVVAIWIGGGPPNPDIVFAFKNNKTKEIMRKDSGVF